MHCKGDDPYEPWVNACENDVAGWHKAGAEDLTMRPNYMLADGLQNLRGVGRRFAQQLVERPEQLLRRFVLEVVQDLTAPVLRLRRVGAVERGGEGLEVLAEVVEVQHGLRAFLEAVIVDAPQPHAAVHDEKDVLCLQKAHPHRLPVKEDAEVAGGRFRRNRDDVLLQDGFALPADGQQV
ncbi:MAG: hypothetical protein PHG71_09755 [Kiritimatiellae bacterium]|nr:hypothetical protein [Kiritimatiellia bacterium]MDD4623507.1 hypothetical protein [Kiritimatiellia bacterium]